MRFSSTLPKCEKTELEQSDVNFRSFDGRKVSSDPAYDATATPAQWRTGNVSQRRNRFQRCHQEKGETGWRN